MVGHAMETGDAEDGSQASVVEDVEALELVGAECPRLAAVEEEVEGGGLVDFHPNLERVGRVGKDRLPERAERCRCRGYPAVDVVVIVEVGGE